MIEFSLSQKKFIFNKKGFLLGEEGLKLIIAVIVLVFLIYFLVSLYMAQSVNKEKEEAKASLKKIIEAIRSQNDNSNIFLFNPKDWLLVSFVKGEIEPVQCFKENCICVCPITHKYFFIKNKFSVSCNRKGVCEKVSGIRKFNSIKIKESKNGITKIKIEKKNKEVIIKNEF